MATTCENVAPQAPPGLTWLLRWRNLWGRGRGRVPLQPLDPGISGSPGAPPQDETAPQPAVCALVSGLISGSIHTCALSVQLLQRWLPHGSLGRALGNLRLFSGSCSVLWWHFRNWYLMFVPYPSWGAATSTSCMGGTQASWPAGGVCGAAAPLGEPPMPACPPAAASPESWPSGSDSHRLLGPTHCPTNTTEHRLCAGTAAGEQTRSPPLGHSHPGNRRHSY